MSDRPQTLAADRSVYALWPLAAGCHTYIYVYGRDTHLRLSWLVSAAAIPGFTDGPTTNFTRWWAQIARIGRCKRTLLSLGRSKRLSYLADLGVTGTVRMVSQEDLLGTGRPAFS